MKPEPFNAVTFTLKMLGWYVLGVWVGAMVVAFARCYL
jgi:hypothetical protein